MIDLPLPLLLLLAPTAAVLTWAACHWWYGRKLKRMAQRVTKLQAEREMLHTQIKQARHQLEQASHRVATRPRAEPAAEPAAAARAPSRPAASPAPPTVREQLALPSGLVFETPQTAAHGFADTMPFVGEVSA
jgi:Tfp pilus assembly protein FimV